MNERNLHRITQEENTKDKVMGETDIDPKQLQLELIESS